MRPALPLGRRAVLRGGAALGLSLPLSRLAWADAPLVPRRVFFSDPDFQNVQISPDGQRLAYAAPLDGVRNLFVADVADPQHGRPVSHATDRDIGRFFVWAYSNRHLLYFRDHDGDENWRALSVDLDTGKTLLLTPEQGVTANLQEADPRFPDEMLLTHNARDKRFADLYRVNIATGDSRLVFENREYAWLATDSQFRLRLGGRYAKDGSLEVIEQRADGSWGQLMSIPIGDLDNSDLLDFSDDGETLYMLDTRGRDKAALVAFDMARHRSKVLAQDPEADIDKVHFADRVPLAARAKRDHARWYPLDTGTGEDLARLKARSPGDVFFVNSTRGNTKTVVYYERDTASGDYVLLDREAGRITPLYVQRKVLDGLALRPMQPVRFRARDGLALNGYLTEPAGPAPHPLVLVIHGGPYFRDEWGFNSNHQWLADRGYAALSVNYRGSTGYGKAFVTAADHQWGGKMHDDLIDALDWAIAKGIADPRRVGFFGGSYGGYSALIAATKTPDRFTCIVDLFGISNLITFMKTIPPYWGPWFSVWKNRLGDPATEKGRAFLEDRSPLNHIDRATKPILIAQGMRDVRVVPAESQQMVTALTAKGVPVTYVTFADEGHGFVRPENRLAFAAVCEAFLAKYLGGSHQPVGDDFTGSSIKIETGRELISGLG